MIEVVFPLIAVLIHPNETGGPAWMLLAKGISQVHLSACPSVQCLTKIPSDWFLLWVFALGVCLTANPSKTRRMLFGLWRWFLKLRCLTLTHWMQIKSHRCKCWRGIWVHLLLWDWNILQNEALIQSMSYYSLGKNVLKYINFFLMGWSIIWSRTWLCVGSQSQNHCRPAQRQSAPIKSNSVPIQPMLIFFCVRGMFTERRGQKPPSAACVTYSHMNCWGCSCNFTIKLQAIRQAGNLALLQLK